MYVHGVYEGIKLCMCKRQQLGIGGGQGDLG